MPRSPVLSSLLEVTKDEAVAGKDAPLRKKVKKRARVGNETSIETKNAEGPAATAPNKKGVKKIKKKAYVSEPVKEVNKKADVSEPVKAVDTQVPDLFSKGGWKSAVKVANDQAQLVVARKKNEAEELKAAKHERRKRKATDVQDDGECVLASSTKERRAESGSVTTSKHGESAFRKAHEITVGTSCPAPWETFDDAAPSLGAALTKALTNQGYKAPTPIQAQAWPIAMEGRDMVAVAKTGSGKTCGFLLPALARIRERGPAPKPKVISSYQSEPACPSVLVLAPTRELAQQIATEAGKMAASMAAAGRVRIVSIYGGVPKGDQVRELKQGVDVLIATPGRLLDFSQAKPDQGILPCVDVSKVSYLVLDEADRMLDMGFEPDIRTIVNWCPKTGKPEEGGGAAGALAGTRRQTLFFTATWPKAVQRTAASFTSASAVQIRIGQGGDDKLTANKNVTQLVSVVTKDQKKAKLDHILSNELKKGETAIVFASTKGCCDYLEKYLNQTSLGCWVGAIHSGREQWEREESLRKFRELTASKKGERGVLIATDVAARGLDIPGVAIVVVYDFSTGRMASGVEGYVHKLGRTGRAGCKGRAFAFFMREEPGARELVDLLRGADQAVPDELAEIAKYSRAVQGRQNDRGGKGGGNGKGGGKGKDGKGKCKGKGKGGKGGKSGGKGGKGYSEFSS